MRIVAWSATVTLLAGVSAACAVAQQTPAVACVPSDRMPVAGRTSPYDSAAVMIDGERALVCYGRPSLRGRTMIGGASVPYGRLWRTGANEPTVLHLPFRAEVAGLEVDAGSYSLYTVPGETEWVVILNRSTSQWGHESAYTDEVRAQEVGRATVPVERLDAPIEMFTIRSDAGDPGFAELILEWDRARIAIPIRRR
jgi:hypothetical protein